MPQLPASITVASNVTSEVITVTNYSVYSSIVWYCNGEDGTVSTTNGEFTLNITAAPFNGNEGIYYLTVTGITTAGSMPYSTQIPIEVEAL